MKALKNGHPVAILIDQKYNEGLEIPFFNQPAMTNPIAVQLAQKYNAPLIPIRMQRQPNGEQIINILPPVPTTNKDGTNIPVPDLLQTLHTMMEGWITNDPDQWLWLHRRWKKE